MSGLRSRMAGVVPASLAALALVASAAGQGAGARWLDDLERARTVAQTEGKHVLVDFTGTGWCAWCAKLDADVLSKARFTEAVAEEFVLVRLEFDERGKARRDRPHAARNEAFREAVGAAAFPTLLLLTADGVPYATEGYSDRGPGAWADWALAEQRRADALGEAVPRVVAAVAGAESPEEARAASLRAAEVLAEAGPHVLARPLVPLVQTILREPELAVDRERTAVTALVRAEAVDDDVLDRSFRLDPQNAAGLPEAALAAAMMSVREAPRARALIDRAERLLRTTEVHDAQRAARLYGDCAYWAKHALEDADRARALARFALRLEPTDRRLREMLEALSGS